MYITGPILATTSVPSIQYLPISVADLEGAQQAPPPPLNSDRLYILHPILYQNSKEKGYMDFRFSARDVCTCART